ATTNIGTNIGSNAGRDVAYKVSGTGTLNVVASNTSTVAYSMHLGRNMGNFKSSLILQSGGTVNVGVTANSAGQINLVSVDGNSNSLLDVQGGALTVGTGKTSNKLYFFAAGANAGKTSTMTQSGGTATLNGIQFGANTGDDVGGLKGGNAYDATALATLQLSGGNLYIGAQGITRGSAAAALPVTIQLQGGTLGASQNWSSSMGMKLGTAATVQAADSGSTARNITLSGVLSNDDAVTGSLTKTGGGSLTLAGANSYSGATIINAGELKHSTAGSATTDITVADGATNGVLVAAADGQWVNTGSLTYADNSTLRVDFGLVSPSTTMAPMKVASLALGTGMTMRIDGSVGGFLPGLTFPLATWTGSGPTDATAFTTLTLPSGISGTLGVTGNTLTFTVTGNTSLLAWNKGDGVWDTATANWVDSTPAAASYVDTMNAVMFGDAAGVTGNPTVTLNDTFSPLGVLMKSTSHDYTISGTGTIAGSGGVVLDTTNTRTLTLANTNNTFTGSTTVGGGKLQLGGVGKLGGGSYAGAISIGSGATFENAGSATQTLSGAISGTGGTLSLSGIGQLILSNGGNSYGALAIGNGRVFINTNATALPAAATVNITGGLLVFGTGASYGNAITFGSGAGLVSRRNGGTVLTGDVILPATGNVIFNNDDASTYQLTISKDQTLTGPLTVQVGGSRMTTSTGVLGAVTLSGKLTGNGSLVLNSGGNPGNTNGLFGTGVLTLTGNNDYTGDTTVNSGVLAVTGTSIPDAGKLVINAPGKMSLTGAETVNTLFFGAVQQPDGTYSSTSVPPGATITTASFTGGGSLIVTTGPAGFSSWITGTFANGTVTDQTPNGDDDKDGITNLIEYAIAGQDPTVPNPNIGSFDGTTLSFTKRSGTSGLIYAIEESISLGVAPTPWTEVTDNPPSNPYVNDSTTISYKLTPGTPVKNFVRLRVFATP
ncbi:MAG: beta strand repeat-containing protein, partial [Verrucomicrobiales bacterium]